MPQAISLCKQSKKAQRQYHAAQRGSWHGINPVTRCVPSGKTYSRSRFKRIPPD